MVPSFGSGCKTVEYGRLNSSILVPLTRANLTFLLAKMTASNLTAATVDFSMKGLHRLHLVAKPLQLHPQTLRPSNISAVACSRAPSSSQQRDPPFNVDATTVAVADTITMKTLTVATASDITAPSGGGAEQANQTNCAKQTNPNNGVVAATTTTTTTTVAAASDATVVDEEVQRHCDKTTTTPFSAADERTNNSTTA